MSSFKVIQRDLRTAARRGLLETAHGTVKTPAFMPVGSSGAVKGVTPRQVEESGADIILANTYHLLLRPGVDCVEKLGGLHKFMSWSKPILTDSGGYQVFSLSTLSTVSEDGVEFSSHIDGAKVYLSAETAIQAQNRLGSDIIMCLDQCTPFPCGDSELRKAVERTVAWAIRARNCHSNSKQLLFAIVQGGTDLNMRNYCASELVKLNFDGYAIGGLGVGEGHANMVRTVEHTTQILPDNKPRYLMGVGMPADIIAAVRSGVDMFDCVLPTRNGRNAFAFTEDGPLRLRNNAHAERSEPIEGGCDCCCCRYFGRGTIRHFFNTGEMLGPILLSIHNLRFYQRLMADISKAIEGGDFDRWAVERMRKYEAFDRLKKNVGNSANSL